MPLTLSHPAGPAEMQDVPLSPGSRGLWVTFARSQPDAFRAGFSVSVTSPALMVVHGFQATTVREKPFRTVDRQNRPQAIALKQVKSVCRSRFGARATSTTTIHPARGAAAIASRTARFSFRPGKGISGATIATEEPDFFGVVMPSQMTSEPTVWNYNCSGNASHLKAVVETPAILPVTFGLTRQ